MKREKREGKGRERRRRERDVNIYAGQRCNQGNINDQGAEVKGGDG